MRRFDFGMRALLREKMQRQRRRQFQISNLKFQIGAKADANADANANANSNADPSPLKRVRDDSVGKGENIRTEVAPVATALAGAVEKCGLAEMERAK